MTSANLSNILQVRDQVVVHAQECRDDSIIALATYGDPLTTMHGNIFSVKTMYGNVWNDAFQVSDPGSFTNDGEAYVHFLVPKSVFLLEDGTHIPVEDCRAAVRPFKINRIIVNVIHFSHAQNFSMAVDKFARRVILFLMILVRYLIIKTIVRDSLLRSLMESRMFDEWKRAF